MSGCECRPAIWVDFRPCVCCAGGLLTNHLTGCHYISWDVYKTLLKCELKLNLSAPTNSLFSMIALGTIYWHDSEITTNTEKRFDFLLNMNLFSSSSSDWIKKITGPLVAPGPLFAYSCFRLSTPTENEVGNYTKYKHLVRLPHIYFWFYYFNHKFKIFSGKI